MKDQSGDIKNLYSKISRKYADRFDDPSFHIDDFLNCLPNGAKVLDAGCGPGTDASYMTSRGFDVMGVDLSEKMIAIARKKCPEATFENGDMKELDFAPEFFDGIVVSFSLIHIPKKDVPETLKQFYNFLKPDGLIFIGIQEGESKEIFLEEPLIPGESIFLNIFFRDEIIKLLEKAGFSIVKKFERKAADKEFNFTKFILIAKK